MLQYLFPLCKKETMLHIFLQGKSEEKRKPAFLEDGKKSVELFLNHP